MNKTVKPMSKQALVEIKKVADKLNIPLSKLLFGTGENIILLENNAEGKNVTREVSDQQITMESKIVGNTMRTFVNVPDNYVSDEPIHFCFILNEKGTKQAVQPTWHIGKNAKVKIFAYCFGVEYDIIHGDGKKYYIEDGASLEVYEFNYNANESYMTVYNTFMAELGDNAFFRNYYVSTVGHLGHGITKGEVYCKGKNSKADFTTKNRILEKDISDLNITFYLEGENSSGTIVSKSVTCDGGTNNFRAKMAGIGDNTKGHVECDEISMGNSTISTIPELLVKNSTSRLTHEAAVGTLEEKAIDNLMIKGFNEEQAVAFLVNGILDI